MSTDPETEWALLLQEWRDDGTMDRLIAACESRMSVLVERRDGRLQPCHLSQFGAGGVGVVVTWKDPDGADLSKVVSTSKLLEWNPFLGPIENRGEPQPVGLTDAEWRAQWMAARKMADSCACRDVAPTWNWDGDGRELEALASATVVTITASALRDLIEEEFQRGRVGSQAAK